jgi:hypothetical protein
MSAFTQPPDRPTLWRRIAGWWRACTGASATELLRPTPAEADDVARRLKSADLYVLAGRWPNSAESLTRRLAELGLDNGHSARSRAKAS